MSANVEIARIPLLAQHISILLFSSVAFGPGDGENQGQNKQTHEINFTGSQLHRAAGLILISRSVQFAEALSSRRLGSVISSEKNIAK